MKASDERWWWWYNVWATTQQELYSSLSSAASAADGHRMVLDERAAAPLSFRLSISAAAQS